MQDQIRYWSKGSKITTTDEMIRPQPDTSVLLGYGLLGVSALGVPGGELTQAMVWYLAATQSRDGSWLGADYRPPMEDGPIQGTAFAVRAMQLYPLAGREAEISHRVGRARDYLRSASPVSLNQQVFQLLGLGWAGEDPERLRPLVDALVARQRESGGWSQLEGLPADAWATGQSLVALMTIGALPVHHSSVKDGIRFLLRTQFDDGSWYVRSRAWPFQPHFESGFPHGKDQWISAGGTAWAAMALLLTQPAIGTISAVDWMDCDVPRPSSSGGDRPASAPVIDAASKRPRTVDFVRDVEPLLERSCMPCHGMGKTKGRFQVSSRADLLKGGQSGEPAVLPGDSARSLLMRMITDRVEDLEMPPLSKRHKYPPMNPEEVVLLSRWIDEGVIWKLTGGD